METAQPFDRLYSVGRWGLSVILLVGIGLAFLFRDTVSADVARQYVDSMGFWAGPGFVGLYAVAALLLIPCFPLTLAAGAIFGPVQGTLLNLLGATAGATAAFKVSRYLAGDWARQMASGRLESIVSGVESGGWQYVAVMRLIPVVPYILLNYAFGLTRIRWTRYVMASFFAMIPAAAVCAVSGYAGRRLLLDMEGPWTIVVPCLGVVGTVAVGWWLLGAGD